tara:strand:+ start:214 stop:462 length:249 start_codon:yes stop_codon:yes gene_type:complete
MNRMLERYTWNLFPTTVKIWVCAATLTVRRDAGKFLNTLHAFIVVVNIDLATKVALIKAVAITHTLRRLRHHLNKIRILGGY